MTPPSDRHYEKIYNSTITTVRRWQQEGLLKFGRVFFNDQAEIRRMTALLSRRISNV
jgi:hypothetical protein